MKIWVFTDFDGTVSNPDTIDLLGKIFDRPSERAVMRDRLATGALKPSEWLAWEIGLVDAPLGKVLEFLRDVVVIDPTFPAFAGWCRKMGFPLTILSNGLEEIIRSLLSPFDLGELRLEANHLEEGKVPWKVVFKDGSAWGHDKSAYLKKSRIEGYAPVFVGDGVSDQEAALCAEVLFAKGELASICERIGLEYYPFASFEDVRSVLEKVAGQARP
ncbi:MAG: HAD-IB family phosphatase [Candidatus Brockarchaeota archaeon]|nr:HAD-IB family phosphatase [Candidatus Brockarchaeota archaeon]